VLALSRGITHLLKDKLSTAYPHSKAQLYEAGVTWDRSTTLSTSEIEIRLHFSVVGRYATFVKRVYLQSHTRHKLISIILI